MPEIELFRSLFKKENLHYCIYSLLLKHERDQALHSQLIKMTELENKHMHVWKEVLEFYKEKAEIQHYSFYPWLFLFARKVLGKSISVDILNIYEKTALGELSIKDFLNVINIVPKSKLKRVVDLVTDELYNEGLEHAGNHTGIISHVREIVFGMNDGLVEVLAAVAGLVGIYKSNLVAALAGLIVGISGTLSMAVGAYLSSRSQKDVALSEIKLLQLEVGAAKERLSKEINIHYKNYRNLVKSLDNIIKRLKSKNDPFHKILEKEKSSTLFKVLNKDKSIFDENRNLSPTRDAFYVGAFYMLGAVIPLLSFFFGAVIKDSVYLNLIIALIATSVAILITASLIALYTNENIIRRMVQSLALSLAAAGVTFLIGNLVSSYLNVVV